MFLNCSEVYNIKTEICIVLWYYAALSGSFLPTFRNNLSGPSSRFKKSKAFSRLKIRPISQKGAGHIDIAAEAWNHAILRLFTKFNYACDVHEISNLRCVTSHKSNDLITQTKFYFILVGDRNLNVFEMSRGSQTYNFGGLRVAYHWHSLRSTDINVNGLMLNVWSDITSLLCYKWKKHDPSEQNVHWKRH
jgi:hypothetical protein